MRPFMNLWSIWTVRRITRVQRLSLDIWRLKCKLRLLKGQLRCERLYYKVTCALKEARYARDRSCWEGRIFEVEVLLLCNQKLRSPQITAPVLLVLTRVESIVKEPETSLLKQTPDVEKYNTRGDKKMKKNLRETEERNTKNLKVWCYLMACKYPFTLVILNRSGPVMFHITYRLKSREAGWLLAFHRGLRWTHCKPCWS